MSSLFTLSEMLPGYKRRVEFTKTINIHLTEFIIKKIALLLMFINVIKCWTIILYFILLSYWPPQLIRQMISIYFKQIYFWKKTHMYRATQRSTDHQSRISARNTCLVHPASFTRVHCYYKHIGNAPPTYTSKIMYISDCFFVFLRLVRHDPNCVYTCKPLENIMYALSGHCRRIILKPNGWLRCAPF